MHKSSARSKQVNEREGKIMTELSYSSQRINDRKDENKLERFSQFLRARFF